MSTLALQAEFAGPAQVGLPLCVLPNVLFDKQETSNTRFLTLNYTLDSLHGGVQTVKLLLCEQSGELSSEIYSDKEEVGDIHLQLNEELLTSLDFFASPRQSKHIVLTVTPNRLAASVRSALQACVFLSFFFAVGHCSLHTARCYLPTILH